MFKLAVPVLHVSNSIAAEEFYCKRLGFRRVFAYRPHEDKPDPCYMAVTGGGALLHLSSFSGDGVGGGVICLMVDDVNELHAQLGEKGVAIDTGPIDQTWGTREMYVKDADRNSIRFTQELMSGVPA